MVFHSTNRYFIFLIASFLTGAMLVPAATSSAQDLLVFPKRIVFEGTRNRSENINLTNTGKDTARYEISFVQIRMREDGRFENIVTPDVGQSFADSYLRYFPRRVVLAPNESQTVKIQLSQTSKLQAGEYRSHLYFRSVPKATPIGEEEATMEEKNTSISIRLTAVYGVTIPAIIRIGESNSKVQITNPSFEMIDHTPILSMDFNRTGNMSTYGDIEITHTSPEGKKTNVAEVSGFAVYTPGNVRKTRIELKRNSVDYRSGKLAITYSTQGARGKNVILDEADLILN